MKNSLKYTLSVAALVLGTFAVQSQDIHHSMYNETPVLLNPARAGVPFDARIILNYKSQWASVASPYKTVAMSSDFALFKKKKKKAYMGVGVTFYNDQAGDVGMKTTQVGLSFSGILKVDDHNLISAGLMTGFVQRGIGTGNQQWGEQYDGTQWNSQLPTGESSLLENHSFVDLGAGVNWYYGKGEKYMTANDGVKINLGFAVFHPHGPKYSYYGVVDEKLYAKFVVHGWSSIGTGNSNLCIEPSFVYFRQGSQQEFTPGVNFKYILSEASKYTGRKKASAFSLGGYLRAKDAIILTTMFEFSSYACGFSYDVNVSSLNSVSQTKGGFEIFLRFVFPNPFGGTGSKSMI